MVELPEQRHLQKDMAEEEEDRRETAEMDGRRRARPARLASERNRSLIKGAGGLQVGQLSLRG